jgi:hypothetical protein
MNNAAPPQRWFSVWRPSQPSVEHDAADLGTAFGLDMSLGDAASQAQPQAPQPVRKSGWMQRLAAGRKPAA